jgi:hypothetical protein
MERVRVANKGLAGRHFWASAHRTKSRRGMPPRVFVKRVRKLLKTKRTTTKMRAKSDKESARKYDTTGFATAIGFAI